jgi:hypothetical protein
MERRRQTRLGFGGDAHGSGLLIFPLVFISFGIPIQKNLKKILGLKNPKEYFLTGRDCRSSPEVR